MKALEELLDRNGKDHTALEVAIFLWNLVDRSEAEAFLRHRAAEQPSDLYARVFLVQILCWTHRQEEAGKWVGQLLGQEGPLCLENLQADLRMRYDAVEVRSNYTVFPDSTMQNIGFFVHLLTLSSGSKVELITKVTTSEFIGTELMINERVLACYPDVARLSPEVVDVRADRGQGLCLVTMQRVAGRALVVEAMDDSAVDAFVRDYRRLEQVAWHLSVPELRAAPFEIGLSHAYLVSAFQQCNTVTGASRIHAWLEENILYRGYPAEVQDAVLAVVGAMRRSQLLEGLVPEENFVLLHGDLHRNNVLDDGVRTWIIDWGKTAIGPRGIDLVVLFRRFPFERTMALLERNNMFVSRPEKERITFIYALVVVSVMIDIEPIKKEPPDHLFLPACDHILHALGRS
jgi:hypothetical protein